MAAMAVSKEKALEAMIIKARVEGFKKAMEIFGENVTSDVTSVGMEEETRENHRRKRRDIYQMANSHP
jgi:hypothetical protein